MDWNEDLEYQKDRILRINEKTRDEIINSRKKDDNEYFLGELIFQEDPEFTNNNLILSPVGSGKSYLIENNLIPEDFDRKIIYLTSNNALKDSLCPNDNKLRKRFAEEGYSVNFFTTENKESFGNNNYRVHVMTYHEFGVRIMSPNEQFTKNVGLIFCDEIHSLPRFNEYGSSEGLGIALRWLFANHDDKQIFYFTATSDSLDKLEERIPGYLSNLKIYDYLKHPNIKRYKAKSIYYMHNIEQSRPHLSARIDYISKGNYKVLAFTKLKREQKRLEEIALEEGYKPIVLWSINNEEKMNEEQLKVRSTLLNSGLIPEPYNFLIINGSMQEGWNLYDEKVIFAIMDTTDKTEQVQAMGRIRKDIEIAILKTKNKTKETNFIRLHEKYLDVPLTAEDKRKLAKKLEVKSKQGRIVGWPTVSKVLENSGYTLDNKTATIEGKRKRITIINEDKYALPNVPE